MLVTKPRRLVSFDTVEAEAERRNSRSPPWWTVVALVAAMTCAYFATIVYVFGIHDDYETLLYKSSNPFFFNDAAQALSIARPILILVSNIPLAPMHSIADFRWGRVFSLLTVCFLGFQLIQISVRYLRIRASHALLVAIATFLAPGFAFSIMNLASWGPDFVSIALAFFAYAILSTTNVDAFLLRDAIRPHSVYLFLRRSVDYASTKRFLWSSALLLTALYNYPINSLIVCLFPVLALLFSTSSRPYRLTIACRDIAFIVCNLIAYIATTKLIYFPLVTRLYGLKAFPSQGPGSEYRFAVQLDPYTVFARLGEALRVAANLWFLPQSRFYLASLLLVLCATGLATFRKTCTPADPHHDFLGRLNIASRKLDGIVCLAALLACYLLALAPVLYSIGGYIDYRTVVVATALTATIVLYAVGAGVSIIASTIARYGIRRVQWAGFVSAGFVLIGVGITSAQVNTTVRLARQEFAYARVIARQAVQEDAKTLVIIDPRPAFMPYDYPIAEDRQHRAILPYTLGCFSSICLPLEGIFEVASRQAGFGEGRFAIEIFRGEASRSVTCDLFTAGATLPPSLTSEIAARIEKIRTHGNVTCVPFELTWFDTQGDE